MSVQAQDRLLRFAAVVRAELASAGDDVALISRSGLDLSRFRIRHSHAAIAWRSETGAWTARQLYYACDEGRPRLYDQGIAGFVMATDDTTHGYVSIVAMPARAATRLRRAALDTPRALRLLSGTYSASAFAFGLRYQNCNQWVVELLAAAWSDAGDRADSRGIAQDWLKGAGYLPQPVRVSHWQLFASIFVPLVHVDDHPEHDRFALGLHISLPGAIETFVRDRFPDSERIEICHDERQIVVHRGWTPASDGCRPMPGDRVIALGV
ncbi:MAG: DUF2145 domain-containing protein [Rhodocyclaceae bacterium]|nr:DUF2145 domain-containing protein [Rhodocyclaceae bacterium]